MTKNMSTATAPATPARPGKGPLALRVTFEGTPSDPDAARAHDEDAAGQVAFSLTEAGTTKHLAVYVVADLGEVPGIGRLGPDPLADGFDLDAVPADRFGVRESIIGRIRRRGGTATVAAKESGGTEVHLAMPRNDRRTGEAEKRTGEKETSA